MTEADLADLFVPGPGIYLLNHSIGRPPRSARQAAAERFFAPWDAGDADTWPRWLAQVENFRAALGRLLNAPAADFCPQVNLSGALSKLIHSLPRAKGKSTIVFHEQDFPSMGFVLRAAGQAGWHSRMIPATVDPLQVDNWRDHIGENTGVVLVTHVHSNTSARLPVADITALARECEAVAIVDIAQSAGVVPIDLARWQADFVLGSCVKWLCGGPGAGFLWGRPEQVARCQPVDVGWFSHAAPFEFDINDFRYADGILRFWGGTPSVLPFAVAANSIELLLDIGIERIRRHNLALQQLVLDGLPAPCVVTPQDPTRRGGTLVLDFGERREAVAERLRGAQVHFDGRDNGLRLSPHIYNTAQELQSVLACLTG